MRWIAVTLALFLFLGSVPARAEAPSTEKHAAGYVCPMPEHPEVFQEPGSCPRCKMRLVERSSATTRTVAILVFDGVQIIDYAAPYEVFGQAGFKVFTVGATTAPIVTAMGLKLIPSHAFADAPAAGIVVLPGGNLPLGDTRIVDWVRSRPDQTQVVLSVCNGAFWLAKAGLLDGLTATTYHRAIEGLQAAAPKSHVVRDRRFVDNGKIVTAAGLTSGMDGALHVVAKLLGRDRAREVALNLEYDWQPESGYARASLADRYLPNLDLGSAVKFEPQSSLGDLNHWRLEGLLRTEESASVLQARIAEQLIRSAQWKKLAPGNNGTQHWSFSDEKGKPWQATVSLVPGAAPAALLGTITLDRVR